MISGRYQYGKRPSSLDLSSSSFASDRGLMSSAGGLSTAYSSLFSSGLDTAGRVPLTSTRDANSHRTPRVHNGFPRDLPANVELRRPSADTDSTHSRRSSLPTFSSGQSDRRYGANGSYYIASPVKSPQAMSFTPSVLLRSDSNATKRSHFKSFLSMDANDPTQISPPPLPSNLRAYTVPGQASKLSRAVSVSSSARTLSISQSPHLNQSLETSNYTKLISNPVPPYTEDGQRTRRSISQSLYEEPTFNVDHHRGRDHDTVSLRTYDGVISDEPPRLDVRLDPSSSRISFNPSDHGHEIQAQEIQERYAEARKSSITDPHSIPPRPTYEPRVRSSLPASSVASIASPPPSSSRPPIPARSLQRNISITSVSTFKSATPSQRSAIKRSRRNEALARLEGNFYDPAPHIQANGSFMPFESDDEEDDADRSANAMLRKLVISPAQTSPSSSSPPPPISPPSPLRARDREQRKFMEVGRTEAPALDTIVEAAFVPSPLSDSEFMVSRTRPEQPPSIIVHSSMWPPLDEDDEEEEESLVTPQPQSTTTPRAVYGSSPLGSKTNLVMHSHNHSSTSLSSFTPFSSTTDAMRPTRSNPSKPGSNSATTNHSPTHKPDSINTTGSNSHHSHDVISIESFDSRDLGAALMESRTPRSKQSVQSTPWGSSSSFGHELQRSPWVQGPSAPLIPPTVTASMNTSKPKERTPPKAKEQKEQKSKKGPTQYETWLDMSGDEKAAKDASKKRRWLFGK